MGNISPSSAPPQLWNLSYFNYKGFHSIVLLALVDANYKFLYIDVGANGLCSDGAIFKDFNLYKALENGTAGLPPTVTGGGGGGAPPPPPPPITTYIIIIASVYLAIIKTPSILPHSFASYSLIAFKIVRTISKLFQDFQKPLVLLMPNKSIKFHPV